MSNSNTIKDVLTHIVQKLVDAGIEDGDAYIDVEETSVVVSYGEPIELSIRFCVWGAMSGNLSLEFLVHEEGGRTLWTFDSLHGAIEQVVNLYQLQAAIRRA
jgi:hypothetical protein